MIISAVQFCPEYAQINRNQEKIFQLFSDSKSSICVFPELALSGYLFASKSSLENCAMTTEDSFWDSISTECQRGKKCFVCGFAEKKDGHLFNSAMFIGSNGQKSVYRKVHLFDREKLFFESGAEGFLMVEDQGVKIGVLICFDHMFPEAARTLALQGAQIICHPSNLVLAGNAQLTTQVRSMENKVYWIMANRTGSESVEGLKLEYTGCSQIVDINGKILCQANREDAAVLYAEIPPAAALDKKIGNTNDIFSDRRTEFYHL